MQMPIFEKYIDELLEKSTLEVPAWNIEKAKAGLKMDIMRSMRMKKRWMHCAWSCSTGPKSK